MAHGITNTLREFTRSIAVRTLGDREQRPRDRSLAGKARIKARRADRKD